MAAWKWLATTLHATTSNETLTLPMSSFATSETSLVSRSDEEQKDFDCVGAYEFYIILRQGNTVDWCEWHLNIAENNNAIKAAKKFHQDFEKLKFSSSIIDKIHTIEETLFKSMPIDFNWSGIKQYFDDARQNDEPSSIVKAYTVSQQLTTRINKDSAANTYHALKLYCTLLNCPILAQTQEYTEAITSIFFHPKLDQFLVREKTVYRGGILKDKNMVANYKAGAKIITTTFLSTSTSRAVAESFFGSLCGDGIAIFCTYNISNTCRRTALRLSRISHFQDEQEILILRYVPFTIKYLEWTDGGQKMIICFDECKDQ
jgi:hypothetical protein